jgi:hypothetical protein
MDGPLYFSVAGPARWEVFTASYRKVAEGVTEGPDSAVLSWDLADLKGAGVGNGLYFLRVRPTGPGEVKEKIYPILIQR